MTSTEHRLGGVEQIPPGEGRVFAIERQCVAIFRLRNGELRACDPVCPHQAGPLSDGILGSSTLVCPLHGWRFDLITGEQQGGSASVRTYPVRLDGGQIVLDLPSVPGSS